MEHFDDQIPNEQATEYLLNWIKNCKAQLRDNPEAFQEGRFEEPGLYIGGLKLREGDTVVNDNNGFPYIIRKGCCQ